MSVKTRKVEERLLRQRTIGALLKEARIKGGVTQLEVARKLGYMSSQFVSNWERGEALPPMNLLPKLTSLLKINVRDLIECIHSYQESYLEIEKRRVVELFKRVEKGAQR